LKQLPCHSPDAKVSGVFAWRQAGTVKIADSRNGEGECYGFWRKGAVISFKDS
jgi:hypothetical protein